MKATLSEQLNEVNLELAAFMRQSQADLSLGADHAYRDELVVCGILGGKNVGKSTLINALAKTKVSVDAREVGRGTERPMAYVHKDVRSEVARRLAAGDGHSSVDVTLHEADAIKNVVLIDLPDFDSEFRQHLRIVGTIAPLLDRVIWVQTPRKIADRAWVETFEQVVKEGANVYGVLNKVDELLSDMELESKGGDPPNDGQASANERARTFWRREDDWVSKTLADAGCILDDEHRFLLSAAFADQESFLKRVALLWDDPDWSRYHADQATVTEIARLATAEIDRLRGCVLGPVSAERARKIKSGNLNREQQANVERIEQHYAIAGRISQLEQACDSDYASAVLGQAFGPEYSATVAADLRSRLARDSELADELTDFAVERWPLLRIVYWPFGWLSRAVGRRVAPGAYYPRSAEVDPFESDGKAVQDRIALLRSRILGDHAIAAQELDIEPEIPHTESLAKHLIAAGKHLGPRLDAQLLDELKLREHRPGIVGKVMVWLVLLWFPLLQPVAEGGLELYVGQGSLDMAHALYRIVSALSAVHLLSGLAVVAGIYLGVLAGMYARRLRAVRRVREGDGAASQLVEAVDDLLVQEVLAPLVTPFLRRLEKLRLIQARLAEIAKSRE